MSFRFEHLEIWKTAIEYADELYNIALSFPSEEKYALADQLRRAAISISNNIAEGSRSGTVKNFSSFLNISIHQHMKLLTSPTLQKKETISILKRELNFMTKRNFSSNRYNHSNILLLFLNPLYAIRYKPYALKRLFN